MKDMKLSKQISERLRKLMTGYELPHGTEFKDLEAFLAEELERQAKEIKERLLLVDDLDEMKKVIRKELKDDKH